MGNVCVPELPPISFREGLVELAHEVIQCRRCSRLATHCKDVAETKRRAYRDWVYWGKPVPGFGDHLGRLFVLGLAPGAHGANRTGRVFTGDPSGTFLYSVLHEAGFASQAASVSASDGLRLLDVYISCAVRCAPPGNRPEGSEIRECRSFLKRELALLNCVEGVIVLGRLAFDTYLALLRERGYPIERSAFRFGHGREWSFGAGEPWLISSYHPSPHNTSSGRLTESMLREIFTRARRMLNRDAPSL